MRGCQSMRKHGQASLRSSDAVTDILSALRAKRVWLKFALLYFDRIRPIVPDLADAQLSDAFREIQNNTDLVDVYRPNNIEGNNATLDAIKEVENVLKNPQRYTQIFGTDRIDERWRTPDPDSVELWNEKYSEEWRIFYQSEKLARPSSVRASCFASCVAI